MLLRMKHLTLSNVPRLGQAPLRNPKARPGILPSAGSHVLSVTASFIHGRLLRELRKARAAFPTDRSSWAPLRHSFLFVQMSVV